MTKVWTTKPTFEDNPMAGLMYGSVLSCASAVTTSSTS